MVLLHDDMFPIDFLTRKEKNKLFLRVACLTFLFPLHEQVFPQSGKQYVATIDCS